MTDNHTKGIKYKNFQLGQLKSFNHKTNTYKHYKTKPGTNVFATNNLRIYQDDT